MNEYAPVFKEKSYQATVVEGKRYESILRVEAVDADCSPQFSQICSYEIVTPDVPFSVDKDGENRGRPLLPKGSLQAVPSKPISLRTKPDTSVTLKLETWSIWAADQDATAGRLEQQTVVSHSSGGWEVQAQAPARSGPRAPGSQRLPSLRLHVAGGAGLSGPPPLTGPRIPAWGLPRHLTKPRFLPKAPPPERVTPRARTST